MSPSQNVHPLVESDGDGDDGHGCGLNKIPSIQPKIGQMQTDE